MRTIQHILCAACLGASMTAIAQVAVSGGNVSVRTADGTTVNVGAGGGVNVKAPRGGQAAVAVGSGRTAVNVGAGNVASNTAGTIEPQVSGRSAGQRPRKSASKTNDSEFWGEKGFWGDEGEPGRSRKRK